MRLRVTQIPSRCSAGKFRMTRCRPLLFALISGSLIAACGGSSPTSPSGGGGSEGGGGGTPALGQVIVLKGGERMAWDQAAASVQVARAYTYRLFIDGVQSALTDVRCSDTRTSAGYECSGLLPSMAVGQHGLEIAAVSANMQSAVSAPILVRRQ